MEQKMSGWDVGRPLVGFHTHARTRVRLCGSLGASRSGPLLAVIPLSLQVITVPPTPGALAPMQILIRQV